MDNDLIISILRSANESIFTSIKKETLEDTKLYEYVRKFLVDYKKLPDEETIYKEGIVSKLGKLEPSDYYFNKITERGTIKKVRDVAEACDSVLKKSITVIDGVSHLKELISAIDCTDKEEGFIDYKADAVSRWESYLEREALGGDIGLSSPWEELDSLTLGWCPGTLTIIVGPTEIGKSWFLTNQFVHSYVNGHKPLIASIELVARTMAERADAVYSKLDYGMMRKGTLDGFSKKKYKEYLDEIADADGDGWIADASIISTPAQLEMAIYRLNPGIVLLDGLYLMKSSARGANWEQVADVVKQLMLVKNRTKVPIIGTSQFAKKIKKGYTKGEGGDVSDVGYSHSIMQGADVTIALEQTDVMVGNNEILFKFLKGREFAKKAKGLYVNWDIPRNFSTIGFAEHADEDSYTPPSKSGGSSKEDDSGTMFSDDPVSYSDESTVDLSDVPF